MSRTQGRAAGPRKRALATSLTALLIVALLGDAAAYGRPPGKWEPPAPQQVPGVAVKPIPAGTKPVIGSRDRVVTAPREVTWPAAGTQQVALAADAAEKAGLARANGAPATGQAGLTKVDGLPIRVGAAPQTSQAKAGLHSASVAEAATPGSVKVNVVDRQSAAKAGINGFLLGLSRNDSRDATGVVSLEIDYSGFAGAFSADWASRAQLLLVEGCNVDAAGVVGQCTKQTPLATTNSPQDGLLAATVPVEAASKTTMVALSGGSSGGNGNYTATSLSPAGTWQVSQQTGGFSWSNPIRMVPGVNGPIPNLALSYSSQGADGRTSTTNTQGSWIGDGWEMWPGYVERSYQPCVNDMKPKDGQNPNNPYGTGDQCWFSDNATLSLNGRATELVKTADGKFKGVSDDGSIIERLYNTAFGNGDADGEYWKVTTTDGTQYYFGRNRRDAFPADTAATDSTWTVPVFGNHPGEACYVAGDFSASGCTQAWRWNLDYVVDVHNNTMTYFYGKETGAYAREANPNLRATYDRGGYLTKIEYGTRKGTEHTDAVPAKVVFDVADRCLPNSPCTPTDFGSWSDTPWDQFCVAAPCTTQGAPTFWTQKRLAKIRTQVWRSAEFTDVESWTLRHEYLDAGASDGEGIPMWLAGITHTGHVTQAGGAEASDPEIVFDPGTQPIANRVDGPDDGKTNINRFRIHNIWTESGSVVGIHYSAPECTKETLPEPHTNTKRCYPQWYGPNGMEPVIDWFHKYVVDSVFVDDVTGASVRQETYYDYLDTPAWHYADSELVEEDKRTWSQWRGYSKVRVREGAPTGTQTVTEYLYMRGMNGDRETPTGGAKAVSIVDSEGISVVDHEAHAGFMRESIVRNGVGGLEVGGTIKTPWQHGPTATSGPLEAWLTNTETTITRTKVTGAPDRKVKSVTSFDTTYGLATQIDDLGDMNTDDDDRCTRYEYVRNPSLGIVGTVSRTEVVSVKCATTPSRPAHVLSDNRVFYDDPDNFGAQPTRALVVRTEELESWNGSSPVYITTARSTYDIHGRILVASDESDRPTTMSYTPPTGGPVTATSQKNAKDQVTTTTVDPAWGRAIRTVDPNGFKSELTYDGLGRNLDVWTPGRDKATQTPNMKFRYDIRKDAPSTVTTETLLPVGDLYLKSITIYDGTLRARQTQTQAPGGGRTISDTLRDSRGLVTWQAKEYYDTSGTGPQKTLVGAGQPAIPGTVETTFDGAARPVAEIFKASGVEKWRSSIAYDGDRVHITPPAGGTPATTISDARGKTKALRQYHGTTPTGTYDETTYGYDKSGRMTSATDAMNNTWTWEFDLRGRQKSATDPDSGTTLTTYYPTGEVKTTTDANSTTLAYNYDVLGRKTSVHDGSPTGNMRAKWVYDTLPNGIGSLSRSIRYDNSKEYITEVVGYDNAGQPTGSRISIPNAEAGLAGIYETAVTYRPDGSLSKIDLPSVGGLPFESIVYGYNDVGGNSDIVSSEGIYVYSSAFNKLGDLTQRVIGNFGKRTSMNYTIDEPTGRVINALVVSENQAEVADLAYSYDAAGNLLRIADSPGSSVPSDTQCFRYDSKRQLKTAWTPTSKTPTNCVPNPSSLGGPAKYWQEYTYDKTGNRKTQVDYTSSSIFTTTNYAHPAAGAPQAHTVTSATTSGAAGSSLNTYEYDPAGNMKKRIVGGNTQNLFWDAEGGIARITDASGETTYVYDADGNRLLRRDPGSKTLYLAGQELHYNTSSGASACTRYYSHLGVTVAVRTNTGLTWTVTDHHNTSEIMIRDLDMAVQRKRTTPFGETRGTNPTWWAGDKGFLNGTNDPSGLTHLGARMYDPDLGRFITVDPILDISDPLQMNGYAYSNNNPTSSSDPSGEILVLDNEGYVTVTQDAQGNFIIHDRTPEHTPVTQTTTGSGGGAPAEDPEVTRAKEAAERAKQMLINAAKELLQIAMDELGITAALDCFTKGDLGACAETALNVASSFVGGLAGKLLSKYGAPWKWAKGAALVKRIWHALERIGKGIMEWFENSKLVSKLLRRGCNSFVPGTGVLMADGTTKPIEELDVGDVVLATDPVTGETAAKTVAATIIGTGSKNLVEITIDTDGDTGDATDSLIATHNHPFWVPDLNEWLNATDLQVGSWLRTSAGTWVQVTSVKRWTQQATVYNLTVTDIHTYFVFAGGSSVLAHNSGGKPGEICEVPISQEYMDKYPATGQHMRETEAAGIDLEGVVDRPGATKRRRQATSGKSGGPGNDVDEQPPAIIRRDGGPVSTKAIPSSDNRGAGSTLGHLLKGFPNGTRIRLKLP